MRRRIAAVFVLVLPLAGCYSWQAVPPPALPEFLETTHPHRLRITHLGGASMEVRTPYTDQDSLRAVFWASRPVARSGQWALGANQVSFAFTDITSASAGRRSQAKTIGLSLGLALGAVAVIASIVEGSLFDSSDVDLEWR